MSQDAANPHQNHDQESGDHGTGQWELQPKSQRTLIWRIRSMQRPTSAEIYAEPSLFICGGVLIYSLFRTSKDAIKAFYQPIPPGAAALEEQLYIETLLLWGAKVSLDPGLRNNSKTQKWSTGFAMRLEEVDVIQASGHGAECRCNSGYILHSYSSGHPKECGQCV